MRFQIVFLVAAIASVTANPLFKPPTKPTPTAPPGYALAEGKKCFDAGDCILVNAQLNNKCLEHMCYTMTSTGSFYGIPTGIPGVPM